MLPDNDEAGRQHAEGVARSLVKAGIADVQILTLPGLPEKGDVSDWVRAGGTREQFVKLAESAAPYPPEDEAQVDADQWEDGGDPADPERCGASPAHPVQPGIVAYSLTDLRTVTFPPRPALLSHEQTGLLRRGDLAMLYALRGGAKTWFAQGLSLAVASGGEFLKWWAPEPQPVLYVDGEMASEEVQKRFGHLSDLMDVADGHLKVVASDWQRDFLRRLDTIEGQDLLEPLISEAALIVLDNASCLFDPEGEKDPSAWQPAQDWLLSLRRRGKAVLLLHHSNRTGGSRGHSKREDPLNLILHLSRPPDYSADQGARFTVDFQKARAIHGPAVAPFVAALTDEGWRVEEAGLSPEAKKKADLRGRILEFVAAHPGCTKTEVDRNTTGREKTIRNEMDDMGEDGLLRKEDGKWWVK